MTNHWIDVKNAKRILVCGSNAAENHPVVMQFINEAVSGGAKLLVADPRKTRMAGMAQHTGGQFIRIRPGTNGAFMMGLINYAIQNNRYPDAIGGQYHTAPGTRKFWADDNTIQETVTGWPLWSDATFKLNANRTDYERGTVYGTTSGKPVSNLPVRTTLSNTDSVWSVLAQRASYYTSAVVADICDIPGGALAFEAFANEYCVPYSATNGAGTILYAMGGTQFTHASQDLRAYCILQLVLGNIGRAGGGVNALRGIHNVQGSTDQGVLYDLIPGYSGIPPASGLPSDYGKYMNKLYGDPKYPTGEPWRGLQQRGFRNMIWHYFRQGDRATGTDEYNAAADNYNYDKFPKGNGFNHVQMFQNMQATGTPTVKMLVSWGQNPAVTEPNLTEIKEGLTDLEALVVVDMFESETAGCDRKAGGVTWFLPACSFVEEAGSVTNSGRWIQWRYQAIPPQGGSKTDYEIFLRLAKALDDKGAFSHIPLSGTFTNRYDQLYGDTTQYGWSPGSTFDCEAVATSLFKQMCSDAVTSGDYGALWIYRGAWQTGAPSARWGAGYPTSAPTEWTPTGPPYNMAKSRNNIYDPSGGKGLYPCWGWAWLFNRRVFYNNNAVVDPDPSPGDQTDLVVASDQVARLFVHNSVISAPYGTYPVTGAAGYGSTYRAYNQLSEKNAGDGSTTDVQTRLASAALKLSTTITVDSVVGLADGQQLTLNPDGTNSENITIAPGGINSTTKVITLTSGLTKDHAQGELARKTPFGESVTSGAPMPKHWEPRETTRFDLVTKYGQTGVDPTGPYATVQTKLGANRAVNDPTITVTSAAGLADGDILTINPGGTNQENIMIALSGGILGNTITLCTIDNPTGLTKAHTVGELVRKDLSATYPLVLTTFRVTEHFQGGPMTRNVPWLCELVPEAIIEINSADAYAKGGINTGDNVYIDTIRATNIGPFKAVVGTGPQENQRVAKGYVAVPWHWGNKGLKTGPSANNATIDAMDIGAAMPEFKACICNIHK